VLEHEQVADESQALLQAAHASYPDLRELPSAQQVPPAALRGYLTAASALHDTEAALVEAEAQLVARAHDVDERAARVAHAEANVLAVTQRQERGRMWARTLVLTTTAAVLLLFATIVLLWATSGRQRQSSAFSLRALLLVAGVLLMVIIVFQMLPALALAIGSLALIVVMLRHWPAPEPPAAPASATAAPARQVREK
jgi:hypothetical protein